MRDLGGYEMDGADKVFTIIISLTVASVLYRMYCNHEENMAKIAHSTPVTVYLKQ